MKWVKEQKKKLSLHEGRGLPLACYSFPLTQVSLGHINSTRKIIWEITKRLKVKCYTFIESGHGITVHYEGIL